MTKGLSHDEHQHVAAGALIAREGLLPYRDFPHFHTPYLAYAYALLYQFGDRLLLAARLLSVICATAILGIIGSVAYHLFRSRGRIFASLVCAGSVLLAATTKLFTETSGHAWNHEPALLLSLLACVAHIAGIRSSRIGWFAASGALLGLAIGTRITCAPLMAPFGLALWLYPRPIRWRWGRILGFGAGLIFGLSGVLYFFAIVPEHALFGNFGFSNANIAYRFSTGEPRTMTLATKLRFFWKLIVRPDAALFIAGLLPLLAVWLAYRGTERRLPFEVRFILLLLPFALVGSFAPSPLFDQYFFPLVPFVLLAGLYAWASIEAANVWFRRVLIVYSFAVVLSMALGVSAYEDIDRLFVPRKWHPVKLHDRAQEIRTLASTGRVLTLAPIYPLEAGLSIYPSFSTGPMAWRVSPYIESAKANRLGIITPTTLLAALQAKPPTGVLVGFEKNGEEMLTDYAAQHGYHSVLLGDDRLWVRPAE